MTVSPRDRSPLGNIDPLAVPLPHGTEVCTRVEKLVGDRRIPEGVVGRVVRSREGGCDVLIVDSALDRAQQIPARPGHAWAAQGGGAAPRPRSGRLGAGSSG